MPFDPFDTEICASLLLDPAGVVVRAGRGCASILQTEPEALLARRLADHLVPAHSDRLQRALSNVAAGAPSAIVRSRWPRPDGALDVVVRIEAHDDGFFAMVEDVSQRAAVFRSESQMATLVDFAADAWFVHDLEGRIRDANPWAAKSLGYTREEMLALHVADFETTIQPGRMDGVWNRMDIGKPVSVTGRHRRKDGTEFPVSVRLGLFETDDDEVLMLAICHDITALKATEERLETLNATLETEVARRTEQLQHALAERQAILYGLTEGLVAIGPDEQVTLANPVAAELMGTGLPPGTPAQSLPHAVAELARETLATGRRTTTTMERADRMIDVSIGPVEGGNRGVVALLRDVTLAHEVDRMKTDFIATVSHELRTPLTSVLGFAKITASKVDGRLTEHIPADDRRAQRALGQVRKNLGIIISEGERLTALINDVLDISKMEAGRMDWRFTTVDPAVLARRAADSAASLFGEGVVFTVQVTDDLPTVDADPDRIQQVLMNLLSNAAKFTTAGRVTLVVRQRGEGVEFAVEDTGKGIAPAEQETVFDRFAQVGDTLTDKPQGTGLGLPICAQIVAAHGSRITLSSAVGVGSRFGFVLGEALVAEVPRFTEPVVDDELSSFRPGDDVLVVDDDPHLRELLRQQLTDRGFSVRLAPNGYEAVAMVRERPPAVLVLDVMMPVISGFDVAAILKNDPRTSALPILILSIVRDEEQGYRVGVDRYLTKPTDADALADAVRGLFPPR
jgi:hypothetical protein